MSDEPWWMTALRVLVLVGFATGAWNGIKAQRRAKAERKAREEAVEPDA